MRVTSGQTPAILGEDGSEAEETAGDIDSTQNDQKHLRAQCLKRDGYQCQLSGYFDRKSEEENPEAAPLADQLKPETTPTKCCHILSFYIGAQDCD